MNYLPINRKRFYVDVIIAGCVVIFVVLAYVTGKAQVIASNLVAPDSSFDESM